ncbi:hypothetical protein [Catalinimonas niigatensis]|uniref:hypothetical protein n=1 Tax=Catalinimonas niigatensis TaxID=1397264 RepID=UPI002665188A|nr:hypothetical protein [Catalinimonas niigatensis]WPP50036.1 hypothetical protein PZB72_25560 [Catalinimonas niigatensis]
MIKLIQMRTKCFEFGRGKYANHPGVLCHCSRLKGGGPGSIDMGEDEIKGWYTSWCYQIYLAQ